MASLQHTITRVGADITSLQEMKTTTELRCSAVKSANVYRHASSHNQAGMSNLHLGMGGGRRQYEMVILSSASAVSFRVLAVMRKKTIYEMRKLLRLHGTYCTNALDVLFIHNGNRAKVNEWKKMCSRNGYSIVHGLHNDTTGSGRGAAALLMKMSTFNLTEKDLETQPSPGGRIAHKKVLWKDMILNPVSIYVPVNADERITFRKQQIFNHKKSTRFNNRRGLQLRAVENPIFDVVKINDGTLGTYQNQHARPIKAIMRKKQ